VLSLPGGDIRSQSSFRSNPCATSSVSSTKSTTNITISGASSNLLILTTVSYLGRDKEPNSDPVGKPQVFSTHRHEIERHGPERIASLRGRIFDMKGSGYHLVEIRSHLRLPWCGSHICSASRDKAHWRRISRWQSRRRDEGGAYQTRILIG
jgi:hypothetical protein